MEEMKNSKGIIWLIVVLIVLVLELGGYIVYDKLIKADNESNINKPANNNNQDESKY